MNDSSNETYDKAEILDALRDIEDRISGVRYLLEQVDIPDIVVDPDTLRDVVPFSRRVSKKKGC